MPAGEGFGQQGEDGAVLPFGGELSGGGGDGDDQGGDPDEQQADFLEVTDDLVVIEEVQRPEEQGDQRGQDEQDVEVLAPIELLDDQNGDGKDGVHGSVE